MMSKVNGRCGLFLGGGLAAWVANPYQLMAQVSDGAVGESAAPQGLLQIVFSGAGVGKSAFLRFWRARSRLYRNLWK